MNIGDALMQRMKEDSISRTTSNKIFGIFVEQMQNIIRYSAEKVQTEDAINCSQGLVVICKKKGAYHVICGNMIETRQKDDLEALLQEIRKMDPEQLKAFYKRQRRNTLVHRSNRNSARLGFIEMARKASANIEYDIRSVDDYYSYFTFKVII